MWVRVSLLALVLALAASPAAAQVFRWWLDTGIQRALTLAPTQVDALDREFSRTLPTRRALRREFDQASDAFREALSRGDLSDEAGLALITRVEELRRRRNAARSRMLLKMYWLLTPAQRLQLPRLVPADSVLRQPAPP
jgi:Spy/CpxP family protein refolding chaperone